MGPGYDFEDDDCYEIDDWYEDYDYVQRKIREE